MSDARMLSHDVYFTLEDNSAEAIAALLDGCQKCLTGHPGTVFFGAGTLASEYNRPVNDHDFDVALHVVFESGEAHDAYQVSPRHKEFIETFSGNWKAVRVFDSWVQGQA